jgi:cell fate regulator YaaT (PSP1 superfamily)
MMYKTGSESSTGQMVHTFEGISQKVIKNQASLSGRIKVRTLVSLLITSFKERVNLCGKIRGTMMAHGKITLCMDMVLFYGLMDKSLKGYIKIRRKTVLDS